LETHRCPNPDCGETTLDVLVYRQDPGNPENAAVPGMLVKRWPLIPASRARRLPKDVPAAIRDDYDEACRTEATSPKASAALVRRCLGELLRDFYGANGAALAPEIERVASGLPAGAAAETLRAFAAMPNVRGMSGRDSSILTDVRDGDASRMIDLLELLIDETYVTRRRATDAFERLRKVTGSTAEASHDGATPVPGVRRALPRLRGYLGRALRSVSFLRYRP
jgi:hypothetical protein